MAEQKLNAEIVELMTFKFGHQQSVDVILTK